MTKQKGQSKRLRSGFTTGACAAAAAKAAFLHLLEKEPKDFRVSIPFPDGSRHEFALHSLCRNGASATASVIKDAGDDPDVTNGAEISTRVKILKKGHSRLEHSAKPLNIIFKAGPGVGTVTREGLAIPVGEPAINPGPRKMIKAAISEAMKEACVDRPLAVEVTVSVTDGDALAEKTLNRRLGVVGGLSILGTTGIVRPVSAKAWTDTIDVSMNVARKAGLEEILLSTGRTSERAVQEILHLPDEAQVVMGDYLEYALKAAARYAFRHIHLAGMWAKILKGALRIPQTHVRHGVLEVSQAVELLSSLGLPRKLEGEIASANTARHILEILTSNGQGRVIKAVCSKAKEYAQEVSGLPVTVYLVTSDQGVVEKV